MSTSKPRITLTLEPHAYEVVRRLSAAGGASMSATITGFLDVALPAMERMVVVMEAAKGMPEKTRAEMRESVDRAEAALLPVLTQVVEQADMFIAAEALLIKARDGDEVRSRSARPKVVSTPVPVTRGSGQTNREKTRVSPKPLPVVVSRVSKGKKHG